MARLTSCAGVNALVTGASSGIGRLLALRLAGEGARVALVARRRQRLEEVAEQIEAGGGEALVLPCDVGDREQASTAAARALSELGSVDLLVNNSGYGRHRPFLEWEVEDAERMLEVNFLGSLYFTMALLPRMVAAGRGWLVFVSSVAARVAPPLESVYAASKAAMTAFASSLSLEVEDAGVHVLTVHPGAIRTRFFDAEALERLPRVARRRMVEPEPLVDAILAALRSGRRELTYPRWIAAAYPVQALAPGLFRRQVKRATRADAGTRRDPDEGDER
jgi:short-subunit dehydrogenase